MFVVCKEGLASKWDPSVCPICSIVENIQYAMMENNCFRFIFILHIGFLILNFKIFSRARPINNKEKLLIVTAGGAETHAVTDGVPTTP